MQHLVLEQLQNAKWPLAGGEMGMRIRAHDWSRTPLGAIGNWPQTVKTIVDLLLRSPVPMTFSWGPGSIYFYNDAFIPIAGARHPGLLGCRIEEGWLEFAELATDVLHEALSGESLSFRDQEFHVLRDLGPQQAWFNLDYSPILDEGGRPVGLLAVVTETTAEVKAKAQLRETEERAEARLRDSRVEIERQARVFNTTLSTITDFAYIFDHEGRFAFANQPLLDLWGMKLEQAVGKNFYDLNYPEDLAARLQEQIRQVFDTGQGLTDETQYTSPTGVSGYYEYIFRPVFGAESAVEAVAGSTRDISERKRVEAALRTSLTEKDELLKEVHHRVKNNLQVITSLLNLQGGQVDDERVLTLFEETRNRVQSIASIHELLYQSSSFAGVDLAAYAQQLVPDLVRFYGAQEQIRVEVVGHGAVLELERAVPFGLLLNELVSNALKHAFPGGRCGEVIVAVRREGDTIALVVADTGVGMPRGFEYRQASSLGLKLVHVLAQQLGGGVEIMPAYGTAVKVSFPLAVQAEGGVIQATADRPEATR